MKNQVFAGGLIGMWLGRRLTEPGLEKLFAALLVLLGGLVLIWQ